MYRPASVGKHGLSPLDMWEGDLYIPLTIILVAVTVFRVVDVGVVN